MRWGRLGVTIICLSLFACGSDEGGAGDGGAGDPAVWRTDEQLAPTSSSFNAEVMRLRCSGGETGHVLPPRVSWSDTHVIVTFSADPLPEDGYYRCPANDWVDFVVDLGQPLGNRILVDGSCNSEPARGSAYCADEGLRWPTR